MKNVDLKILFLNFQRKRQLTPESEEPTSSDSESSSNSEPLVGVQRQAARSTGTIPPVPKTGHVSEKLRKSIKKGEVINLALLKPTLLQDKPAKRFKFNAENGSFEEEEESQNIGFYNWLECFLIYMSIRLDYFADEAQGLLRHIQNCQGLARSGRDAIEYDLQFRTAKRQHPSIQWGEYLGELVDMIPDKTKTKRSFKQKSTYQSATNNQKWGGHCFKYNAVGKCPYPHCRYKHECKHCNGKHSAVDCKKSH